jgi:hypothetical protein
LLGRRGSKWHRGCVVEFTRQGRALFVFHVRSRTSANDRVERVAENAAGAAVEALDVVPVACLAEVALDQPQMTLIFQSVPDGDGL